MTLFTGSSRVADKLAVDLKGRIKLEDAGFDWKILGPDVREVISPIACHVMSFLQCWYKTSILFLIFCGY